jgi:hypothetical protein
MVAELLKVPRFTLELSPKSRVAEVMFPDPCARCAVNVTG